MYKLKSFIKKRWAYLLNLFFIWIVPVIMLNEIVALVEVNVIFKLTFSGCMVLLILFLAIRKRAYVWIEKKPHGICRGVLLCLQKTITYCLILGSLWSIHFFSSKFYDWWLLCGISWLIGFVFLSIDEKMSKERNNERNWNKLWNK